MGCKQSKDEKAEATAAEGTAEQAAEQQEDAGDSPRLIVVFGATGSQGGSVAAALIKDVKYKVRAITRNPDTDKAKALAEQGAEVVKADLDDADSLKEALEGAYGLFLVTDYFADKDMDKEIQQGKNVVDAAKTAGVEHFVFSGLENVKEALGKACHHFDSKAQVEEYLKEQEVPHTCVRYSFYCENLLSQLKPEKNEDGEFVLGIPMGDVPLDVVPVAESGECIRAILDAGDEYKDKKIGLSCDKLKIDEYAAILTKLSDDKKFVAGTVTTEEFAEKDVPCAGDLAAMFEFLQSGGVERDVELTRKLYPDMPSFEQWAEKNKEALLALE